MNIDDFSILFDNDFLLLPPQSTPSSASLFIEKVGTVKKSSKFFHGIYFKNLSASHTLPS